MKLQNMKQKWVEKEWKGNEGFIFEKLLMKERLKTPGESIRTKLLLSEILNKVNNFWLIIVLYFF